MAAEGEGGAAPAAKKSDLKARTLSAIVMVAVSGGALWAGGIAWTVFVLLVATGVLWEWSKLSRKIAQSWWGRWLWLVAGVVYVGVACEQLLTLRVSGIEAALFPVLAVISVDVGAYFAGRSFGGPKIAPKISPSKTWSGLLGGTFGVSLLLILEAYSVSYAFQHMFGGEPPKAWVWVQTVGECFLFGAIIAIIAQTGDFFESWMKRRAGVKDSGHLIPGHGGLFDRVDGLLAVLFVAGVIMGFPPIQLPPPRDEVHHVILTNPAERLK